MIDDTFEILKDIISKLESAIQWVEILCPNRYPNWRAYNFLKILTDLTRSDDGQSFKINQLVATPVLEAWIAAHYLIELHMRFEGRKEKTFKEKVRASTFGPRYPFQEIEDLGHKRKGSYGRDIESELIFATRIKTPEKIGFGSADIVIDLPTCKLGIEVKRVQNTGHIVEHYIKGCQQIEENPEIEFGMVMFRLDRLVYHTKQNGIWLARPLLKRKEHVTYIQKNMEAVNAFSKFQTKSFREEFTDTFNAETKRFKFKKCLGFGVTLFMPFVWGDPLTVTNTGNTDLVVWDVWDAQGVRNPKRRQIRIEFLNILDFISINEVNNSTILLP